MKDSPALNGADQAEWDHKGWVLVREFAGPDEIESLRKEAERVSSDRQLFIERGSLPNSTPRADRLDPVIDLSPRFAALARDRRLICLASAHLGGPAQLFKDRYIAKPPGAIGYGAHQDGAYWPHMGIDPSRFLTAILFLDDATADNGALECAPGHHHSLLTEPDVIADPDEARLNPFTTIAARAGDVLLVHALTPHRSGPNRSDGMRRALLFTYGVDPRPDLYGVYRRLASSARAQ